MRYRTWTARVNNWQVRFRQGVNTWISNIKRQNFECSLKSHPVVTLTFMRSFLTFLSSEIIKTNIFHCIQPNISTVSDLCYILQVALPVEEAENKGAIDEVIAIFKQPWVIALLAGLVFILICMIRSVSLVLLWRHVCCYDVTWLSPWRHATLRTCVLYSHTAVIQ